MPTGRSPRNAKPLIGKVRALIADFPIQKQLEIATWLSGQLRTDIIPDIRAEAKAEAKTAAKTKGSVLRSGTKRPTASTAKRRLAGQKAAATRKARGTQRGGRRPRTNSETHIGIQREETQVAA